ncbi:hypothetical protein TIFTF001_019502 [Ficus carica]|uniref:Basic blue protein n=1 Tax=Ficus carica TaxID=3494 RepID=A0AA88DCR9_FICCA|nr:hypothetical protein TIFTF001_019502 [Ficus carica]
MSQQQQGRCSASRRARVATGLLLCVLFLPFVTAKATTHLVGDSSGWTFNVESWTNGKKFKAGDILVFNYDTSLHNVAVVDASGYKTCTSSPGAQTYSSGKDQVKLSKGQNYFICAIPGHCDGGVKISINAS